MPDGFEKSLRVLGLAPGATAEAIKEAHRDLVKVWHPDRFGTDERLREKAQEKLKELNAALDHLRSYRPSDPAEPEQSRPTPSYKIYAAEPDPVAVVPKSWRAAMFLASSTLGAVGLWLLLVSHPIVPEPPRVRETSPQVLPSAPSPAAARTSAAPPAATEQHESPAAPATGSLRVDSQPVGARVSFDGAVVGETPVVVTEVEPGEHQVGVDLEGKGYQPWSSSVVVVAGRVERLLAVMTPNTKRR